MQLWSHQSTHDTCTQLTRDSYQIIPFDNPGKQMCEGEFESLKAMYAIVPTFIPKVYKWGHLKKGPGYFLLAEFREVGQQPPDPKKFTMRVAELHHNSSSPNGKFGFHVTTFHGNLPTYTGWEESWTVMYTKILARAMDIDWQKNGPWPEFMAVRRLLFDKVIPRLLDPLSSQGRSIKPCLVHGDLWDENCAIDMTTGEPFAFDAGSLYAHNEYETGYWRPPRHRLSNKAYIRSYKRFFPVSEPGTVSLTSNDAIRDLTTTQRTNGTTATYFIQCATTSAVLF